MTSMDFRKVIEQIVEQITSQVEMSSVAVTPEITHSFVRKEIQQTTLNYNQYIEIGGGSEADISIQDEQKNRWNIITRKNEEEFEAKLTRMGKGKNKQEVRYVEEQEIPEDKVQMIEQMQMLVNGLLEEMRKGKEQVENKSVQNEEREIGD